jgi:hypothetical protein
MGAPLGTREFVENTANTSLLQIPAAQSWFMDIANAPD